MAEEDLDTTLVRHGQTATTFTDMEDFVAEIEHRPLEKILLDLPGLAKLSEMKFALARQTLRRRTRELDEAEREQLRVFAEEIAADAEEDDMERIRSVFLQSGEA